MKGKTDKGFIGRQDTMVLYSNLNVNNCNINKTKQFKYLGPILSEKNRIEKEIAVRI